MRQSGVLLAISSLPSRYGIGCFSKEAYEFVDFLEQAGQKLWQILPIGPTGYGDSPYQSFSSFAGNPYFIDLETLINEGYLTEADCDACDFGSNEEYVDYEKIYNARFKLLKKAFHNRNDQESQEYKDFVEDNNKNRWRIIPYNIALLGSPLLEGELRSRWLHVLQIILDEDPKLTLEIPTLVFKQKDTVLLAVKAFGESIQRFKKFHGDEEVVRMALSSNYGNALTMDCMIPYRDR